FSLFVGIFAALLYLPCIESLRVYQCRVKNTSRRSCNCQDQLFKTVLDLSFSLVKQSLKLKLRSNARMRRQATNYFQRFKLSKSLCLFAIHPFHSPFSTTLGFIFILVN